MQEETGNNSTESDSHRYDYDSSTYSPLRRTRRISYIYDNTERIPDLDLEQCELYCQATHEPINYKQASQYEEWESCYG